VSCSSPARAESVWADNVVGRLELKLSRSDRVYHAGDTLQGEVVVTVAGGVAHHSGLRVTATGSVQMRVSEKVVGVFEAFFLNVQPIPLLNESIEARNAP